MCDNAYNGRAQELNGTTSTANLLTGGVDERFTRTDANGTSNYLTDALGSTIALTDASGNSDVQYSYDPYGSMNATGSTTNSYTYTGREFDGLGIYYYRARYYNPATGRFISEDPIGLAGGVNKYAYVGDDPTDYFDPLGTDKRSPVNWSCVGDAAGQDGLAVALDVASLAADAFAPETQYAKLAIGLGLSTASTVNSAVHQDLIGSSLGMTGYLRSTTELGLGGLGLNWVSYIPEFGAILDGIELYHDVDDAITKYDECADNPG